MSEKSPSAKSHLRISEVVASEDMRCISNNKKGRTLNQTKPAQMSKPKPNLVRPALRLNPRTASDGDGERRVDDGWKRQWARKVWWTPGSIADSEVQYTSHASLTSEDLQSIKHFPLYIPLFVQRAIRTARTRIVPWRRPTSRLLQISYMTRVGEGPWLKVNTNSGARMKIDLQRMLEKNPTGSRCHKENMEGACHVTRPEHLLQPSRVT